MKRRHSSVIYYLFWSCMIFLGSLLGIILLSNIIPESILDLIRGNRVQRNSTQRIEEAPLYEMSFQDTMGIDSYKENPLVPLQSTMTGSTESPIFTHSKITPTGQFTNYKGTVFSAGTLFFTGKFPQDFEQPNTGTNAEITIELSFGWNHLPNFGEIERDNKKDTFVHVSLPPLTILDLQIGVKSSPYSESTQQIKTQISEYIQSLFERQLISEKIVHLAQQRLAAAYIAQHYSSIELIPY